MSTPRRHSMKEVGRSTFHQHASQRLARIASHLISSVYICRSVSPQIHTDAQRLHIAVSTLHGVVSHAHAYVHVLRHVLSDPSASTAACHLFPGMLQTSDTLVSNITASTPVYVGGISEVSIQLTRCRPRRRGICGTGVAMGAEYR